VYESKLSWKITFCAFPDNAETNNKESKSFFIFKFFKLINANLVFKYFKFTKKANFY